MGFSSRMYVASGSRPSGSFGLDGAAPARAPSSVMQTRSSVERHDFMPAPPSSFATAHRQCEVNVEPIPNSLLTQVRPPWSSTNFRHKMSLSPVPSTFFAAVLACPNSFEHLASSWRVSIQTKSHSALLDYLGGAAADAPGWHPRAMSAVAAGDHDPEVIRRSDDRHLCLWIRFVDPVGPRAGSVVDASNQFSHWQPHLGVQELAQLPL